MHRKKNFFSILLFDLEKKLLTECKEIVSSCTDNNNQIFDNETAWRKQCLNQHGTAVSMENKISQNH